MFRILRMRSLMTPTFSLPRPPLFLVVPSKRFSFGSNPIDSTAISLRSNVLSAKSLVFHSHNKGLQSQPSCHFSSSPAGAIHVIVGPMFAGKTTTLLQRIHSETELGRKVAIIKSSKDTRYGLDSIVSHDGVKLPCWALSNLSSFRQVFGSVAYEQLDVIGIDEAQFFEDLYDFCRVAADQHGKTLIVAGLDGDYLRRSFGSVLDIIPLADSVTKLTARCELCGKRALFTLRKTAEKQTELIGGADVYMPVCRQHYVSGQVAMEAARVALELQTVQCGSQV